MKQVTEFLLGLCAVTQVILHVGGPKEVRLTLYTVAVTGTAPTSFNNSSQRSATDVVPCCCDRSFADNIQQELRPVAAQGHCAPQHAAHLGGHAAEPPGLCRLQGQGQDQ